MQVFSYTEYFLWIGGPCTNPLREYVVPWNGCRLTLLTDIRSVLGSERSLRSYGQLLLPSHKGLIWEEYRPNHPVNRPVIPGATIPDRRYLQAQRRGQTNSAIEENPTR